ncbi:MAG: pseudouridine synthase [Arenicella sp.]|jgi:23S rRNA pseudouridine2605 synthase|nr:pseudouridine synthase [bacterium]MDG1906654.1 pseudouridine synthase [Arenicella sp.]HAU66768.1 ribosomal large subunit pseudouridine synthase B [Gammaproteobacteria bacterium]
MSEKLQKVLAHAGRGSRRQIETWITEGRVQVNGRSAKLGDRVDLTDRIVLDGEAVYIRSQQTSQIKAIIYHKPEGEIVSRNDPAGRPTVFEKLPSIADSRWVSVGRLDINTSGLLLFTNSGELANKLMHPSTGLEREYLARVRGQLNAKETEQLTRTGIDIDGKLAKFESVIAADMGEEGSNHWYRVVIKEGRYREVRKLFEAVNHLVSRLKRIRYGSIKLTRDVKLGHAVKMAPQQLEKLISAAGIESEFGDRSSVGKMRSSRNARTASRNAGSNSSGGQDKDQRTRNSRDSRDRKPTAQEEREGARRGSKPERNEMQSERGGARTERGTRSGAKNTRNRNGVSDKATAGASKKRPVKAKRKPKSPRRERG